ncbi:MAG: HD domain-containing protein, partial [Muribaculaceae bacterium]|nr:HD domain-containing protein [Muribaculaceae bacterium]
MEEIQATQTRLPLSLLRHCRDLYRNVADAASFSDDTDRLMRSLLRATCTSGKSAYDDKGLPRMVMALETADAFAHFIDADSNIIQAILLCDFYGEVIPPDEVQENFGDDVASMLKAIETVAQFSAKRNLQNQDNFRGLMLSLADDIRVIIIMIVRDLVLMRNINNHPDQTWVSNMAFEANVLYAQLAHRLGLYKIKGELEDLSLKYTNREIYKQIAHKLNETKRSRDAYIEKFIAPVKRKLEEAGLTFTIKGRTKSISSIWAKMRKQKVDLDRIYDLFAIRVIIDTPPEKEKSDCWLAYSILTDMYTPNPARMRDWISIPKSNGYESLHATVMGPDSKWVEVQFRTRRMDLVAEKGLAAHWRYKGVKSDSTDQWMNNIRDILEAGEEDPMQLMKDIRMDIYSKEVYAFTPKGDLFKLPAGATVLDFAFYIHSNVGAHCTGGIVNGRHRKISHVIQSGDTVEILTSASQTPKSDWLNVVVSSKSRSKIRQKLHEALQARAELGKEELLRRAKNRKIEIDEASMMKLIKKEGYKYVNEFYADIADHNLDAGKIIALYQA